MPRWQVINNDTGTRVVTDLQIADRLWARVLGLQLRSQLPMGSGLLLVPCASVHTFLVRFSIDVIFLNKLGGVIEVRRQVRPWRIIRKVHGVYATLEVPYGGANNVRPGNVLSLQAAPGNTSPPPKSVLFLWHSW